MICSVVATFFSGWMMLACLPAEPAKSVWIEPERVARVA